MKPSDHLRASVAADLHPVRPLLRPWQRALLFAPAAALAWAAAPAVLGLRSDLQTIGPLLAWGGSIVQFAIAIVLMTAALREAIPAEALPASAARLLVAAGVLVTIVLALATNAISPEPRPRAETLTAWWTCWQGALLTGAPIVLLLAVLIACGLPMRPGLAGALAGMGAGTAVDGGWRLYCSYSNPGHVLASHGGAVVALTLAGMAAGIVIGRLRRRLP